MQRGDLEVSINSTLELKIQLIDFSEVNKRRTNDLLRKYVDTQNFNSDLSFMVILDDLENDKYKSDVILAENMQ